MQLVPFRLNHDDELTIFSHRLSYDLPPSSNRIISRSDRLLAIFLTTWHLAFATLMTQILARTTNLLDGRKTVKMTGRVYLRAIVPIGLFFSLSLICGNVTYLYLSVAFIQMLKVCLLPVEIRSCSLLIVIPRLPLRLPCFWLRGAWEWLP